MTPATVGGKSGGTTGAWPSPQVAVFAVWAFASVLLILVNLPAIAALRFPDPDDAMRLMEARDWMAGQSWWDVGQHRLDAGRFAMHWSRLVDLPLAPALWLGDRIGPQGFADRLAMTAVPLLTMLAVMAAVDRLTRRLAGPGESGLGEAVLAMLLVPLSVALLAQLRPMRIDHHGWQVALALAAVASLVGPPTARRGAAAGAALAALVTISMEGLPIAVTITGVAVLAWVVDPTRRRSLQGWLAAFAAVAIMLHVVTRGPGMWAESCDAMAPGWLGAILCAAAATIAATVFAPRTVVGRLTVLMPGAVAAASIPAMLLPSCLKGPFATLPPLARILWYQRVSEGLPLWQQPAAWAVVTIAGPIVGIVGTVMAIRQAVPARRAGWLLLLAVLVPATLLACLVNRAGATANALALPGIAVLLQALLHRTRAIRQLIPRTLATAAALLMAAPGVVAAAALPGSADVPAGVGPARPGCRRFEEIRALAKLPPATIFLPLDVAPDLLATSGHHAIGAGYHRNPQALERVLTAFTAQPAVAERIVRASGADYVAGCPGLNETLLYDEIAPQGLWARLERGERFAWLEPVPLPGSAVLAWRVRARP